MPKFVSEGAFQNETFQEVRGGCDPDVPENTPLDSKTLKEIKRERTKLAHDREMPKILSILHGTTNDTSNLDRDTRERIVNMRAKMAAMDPSALSPKDYDL
ncbi:MAG: hypothetical protein KBD24_00040 [Candidatus Pacebacteria bacterium]|nr:hypothetical protein [Candidatus Paceibacterota bacterium]